MPRASSSGDPFGRLTSQPRPTSTRSERSGRARTFAVQGRPSKALVDQPVGFCGPSPKQEAQLAHQGLVSE